MRYEFRFEFDAAFIYTALKRNVFWKAALFNGLLLGILVLSRLWIGSFAPLVVGVTIGAMILATLRLHFVLRTGARRVYDLWSKQTPEHVIIWQLDDEGFKVDMDATSSSFEWKGLRRLWRYRDVWILEIVKNMSVFFPPDAAPEEVREYIVARCIDAGVRV